MEGRTFIFSEAEQGKHGTFQICAGREESLVVVLTFWGQITEYHSCSCLFVRLSRPASPAVFFA